MERIRVQARALQPGDQLGSGEKVARVSVGAFTPRGKVEVILSNRDNDGVSRICIWGSYTQIGVTR